MSILSRLSFLLFGLLLIFTSCDKDIEGCTDPTSHNYNPEANVNDGSCVYYGCTDPNSSNYDPRANFDNGSCKYITYGCTSSFANNYNSNATADDNSCVFSNLYFYGKYSHSNRYFYGYWYNYTINQVSLYVDNGYIGELTHNPSGGGCFGAGGLTISMSSESTTWYADVKLVNDFGTYITTERYYGTIYSDPNNSCLSISVLDGNKQ